MNSTLASDLTLAEFHREVAAGLPDVLPTPKQRSNKVPHAPVRKDILTPQQKELALANALRYFPAEQHEVLAPEFAEELKNYGRIYMYRFMPDYDMYARPIDAYPAQTAQAAGIMLMIQNNLDPAVAQHPEELITYGGNGAVFQNWAQYRLVMRYLSEMTEEQTLVMYSGHPLGLFPSHPGAPRVVVTNGMVIPNYSGADDLERMNALGVSQYGQMTAGSYMYIGPQGIVHGTTITVLNAGRRLDPENPTLAGKLFVTAGLGGMSGAQPKAGNIAGVVSVTAEVDPAAAWKRHEQGWVDHVVEDVAELAERVRASMTAQEAVSYAYLGNVVDVWEHFHEAGIHIHLGSDQTSLHNPWAGGYYPAGLTFEEAQHMMAEDPKQFRECVQHSLRRHAEAVNRHTAKGTYFFDYGNAFLLESSRAGADIMAEDGENFRYPSYVQDIMGPMCFDYGFGPFRWVCGSGDPADLDTTDAIACEVLEGMMAEAPIEIRQQMADNVQWIRGAKANKLVVGSQARILYADAEGRMRIAKAFNEAIASGTLSGPVILGRDHHDVSGTDSPYRETSNIYDGSAFTADMAVQNFVGDAFRGATWVSLHNGGGVGWGEVINGGFGMLLDGTAEAEAKLTSMLHWDVNNGIARRSWARNKEAQFAIRRAMKAEPKLKVTLAQNADPALIRRALS
ncbi:MAG: urocanate hydratase [Flavobacteriales bacterium]|nr:urocanate hydratase [Flavobacteriales bacterium]